MEQPQHAYLKKKKKKKNSTPKTIEQTLVNSTNQLSLNWIASWLHRCKNCKQKNKTIYASTIYAILMYNKLWKGNKQQN